MNEDSTGLACCGDDCARCPRRLATVAADERRLAALAELWHRVGFREYLPTSAEMRCGGCASIDTCAHGIRECARQRGAATCGTCADYPCARLRRVLERTDSVASRVRSLCSPEEYRLLCDAFFRKRQNLESARSR